jgi:hypothetical protein
VAATAATVVVAAIVVEFAAVLSADVAAIVTVVVAAAAVLVHPSWWLVLVLLAVNLSFKIVDGRVSSSRRWRRRSRAACRAPLLPHAACRMGTRWPAQTAECGPGDRRKVWRKVWANRPWAVAATVGSGGDRGPWARRPWVMRPWVERPWAMRPCARPGSRAADPGIPIVCTCIRLICSLI